jgi:hypothetical protein
LLALECVAGNDPLTVLEGIVIDATTKGPVRKAHVTLGTAESEKKPEFMATTDEMGRFRFADVEAGRYRLAVEKNGFLDGAYGANRPEGEGSILKVSAGEKTPDLVLQIFPAASISGRVLDADGDPMANSAVTIFTRAHRGATTRDESRETANTNRSGEYHFNGLTPGTYYLSASGDDTWGLGRRRIPLDSSGKVTKVRDLKTFYPSGLSFAEAQSVTVESGQEQAGIDIRLQRGATVSVKGRIAGFGNNTQKYYVSASVEAAPEWTSEAGTMLPNGEFIFDALPPGTHRLTLLENGANGLRRAGRTDVTLSDQDVTGVVLTPMKPARVRVRVVMEGEEDKPLTTGSVVLSAAQESGEDAGVFSAFQPQDGNFVVGDVPSGKYRVWFNNDGKAYLKSVQSGGKSLDPRAVEVSEDAALDLLMTFSKNMASVAGEIEGTPEKGDGPMEAVLVPLEVVTDASSGGWDADDRWEPLDQTGHFSDENVRPGKYLAFGVQGIDRELWTSADFVKAMRAEGTELEVAERAHASVHLKVIAKDELEEIRKRLGL